MTRCVNAGYEWDRDTDFETIQTLHFSIYVETYSARFRERLRDYFQWDEFLSFSGDLMAFVARKYAVSKTQALIDLAEVLDFPDAWARYRLRASIGNPRNVFLDVRCSSPFWDRSTRTLLFDGAVIRKVAPHARDLTLILDRFAAQSWRDRIDVPLPTSPRGDRTRLRNAIKTLNRGLGQIVFETTNGGQGITWRLMNK